MGVMRALQPELTSMQTMRNSAGGIRSYAAKVPGIRLRPGTEPRILGLLFAGGPANVEGAIVEPMVRIAAENGAVVFGFEDGFKGLLDGGRGVFLNPYFAQGLSRVGGGIIGTDRLNPTSEQRKTIAQMLKEWGIFCLNDGGGDDTQSTSKKLSDDGANIIGLAKTVDDDLPETQTYGFITAYSVIGGILNTYDNEAVTTNSTAIAQIMGRKSGSLTLKSSQIGGVTRSYIGEEFSQRGLAQLVSACARGEWLAQAILRDIANIVRIGGNIKSADWITGNIGSVPESDIHLDPVALTEQITGIIAQRKEEGRRDNLFTLAEGIAEKLPYKVTQADEQGYPLKAIVPIFGKEKDIEFDEHHNPRLGPLKIGDDINDQVRIATGKQNRATGLAEKGKTIFNSFTYEARCVDVPNPADVLIANAMARQAVTGALAGRFGFMSGFQNGRAIAVDFRDIPFDPTTGKIIPRVVDLSSPAYFDAKSIRRIFAEK